MNAEKKVEQLVYVLTLKPSKTPMLCESCKKCESCCGKRQRVRERRALLARHHKSGAVLMFKTHADAVAYARDAPAAVVRESARVEPRAVLWP